MNHIRFISLSILVAVCTTFEAGYAAHIVNDIHGPELVKSVEYVFHDKFKEAEDLIREYIKNHPDRPDGYFFMAAIHAEHMNSYHDNSRFKAFNKYADLCVKKAKLLIKKNKNDPVGYFYIGGIAGYRGLIQAHGQQLVSAFRSAIKTKWNLEKALQLDPELYDTYFGLGTLYYFASKKHVEEGGIVGWIIKKFITKNRDMRQEAIAMLKKAIKKGQMTSTVAYSSLMWVMICEEEYETAYNMAREVVKKFPEDKHGYWVRARVEMINGNCRDALENFNKIIGIIKAQNLPVSRFNEVQTGLLLTETCLNVNNWERKKVTGTIKNIRRKLNNYKEIMLEYQNAKRVAEDWKRMLLDLEHKSERSSVVPNLLPG
jgi:tetratricopeptide (TPR) repeat protein